MGTWGRPILADDFARDVYDGYMERFDAGLTPAEIQRELGEEFADSIRDLDDGPVYWLALANAAWDTGTLDTALYGHVARIVERGEGLERWREAGEKSLAKRRSVLRNFLQGLSEENPRSRRRKKAVMRKAPFAPGTCLALSLDNGEFGAAIVLAAENGINASGANLVGVLRFKSREMPVPEVFESREWLMLTHHSHDGAAWVIWCSPYKFRNHADQFIAVCSTRLRDDDPRASRTRGGWWHVGEQVLLQFAVEKGA